MSALAMILTAAMVVPGDRPEKVSAELVEPQRLDLRGEWKGVWRQGKDKRFSVSSNESRLVGIRGSSVTLIDTKDIIDDGRGQLHGTWLFAENGIHGIYKWEGKRLFICFSRRPDPPPTSFAGTDSQDLLILRRVNSRK